MAGDKHKNIPASVKSRLLKIAKENNTEYLNVFNQYVHERFLFRIAESKYRNNFILKGALLFLAFDISRHRPTKDIDLLGHKLPNDIETISSIFKEIASIKYNDGLDFDTSNMIVERISEANIYHGIRIRFDVRLGNARGKVQLDLGFGDKIFKQPVNINYPVLLDLPSPSILAYSIESAIAEKFEAIVSLGFVTSRMKDFYDIWFLGKRKTFKINALAKAISLTFENRGTDIKARRTLYLESFKNDPQKQSQWISFLNKSRLKSEKSFGLIVDKINLFIEPVLELKENKTWNPRTWKWE